MGKKIMAVVICFALGAAVFAVSVSFQIVQHADSMSGVCDSALIIEDEIMNSFFNSGFIVSNSPASVSSSSAQDKKLWSRGYDEAVDGQFDDFIQVHLYFNESTARERQSIRLGMIDKISWKIVSLKNGSTLEEKSKDIEKPLGADTESNVRLFANDFAGYIQSVLKKNK